jgi:hypothetical protein
MASLTDYTNRVRFMLGSPDTTEIPDATIQNFITNDALTWINRRRPGCAITYLETVANQQDYDSKPASAYRVTKVWWMDADFEWFSPSMQYLPADQDLNFQMAGYSILDNPALVEMFYKQIAAYRGNFKGDAYETEEGKIRLSPTPGATGDKVYFEYSYPRWSDIANVPAEFVEAVCMIAASRSAEHLFVKRGMIRSGRDFSGGGGANENTMSQRFEERAECEVPIAAAFFDIG